MKKFMKAIAFATVMCMLLSTAAFAAVEVNDYTAKKVTVTVNGVQKGEQVALIITNPDADAKEDILFVDQKAAGASSAVFTATLTDAGEAIDVYAGYASNSTGEAVLVAEDYSLAAPVLDIEVTLVSAQVVKDITTVVDGGLEISKADPGTKGALAYFKINVANGTEGAISDMRWAFTVKNDETDEEVIKYWGGDATIIASLGTVLTGDVALAAAIDSTGYTLEAANVAFKVNGEKVQFDAE